MTEKAINALSELGAMTVVTDARQRKRRDELVKILLDAILEKVK
ncbi:hypothetical protein [Ileibacterium valens]|nr:hypothetical protein [Ileibacterium valens]